MKFVLASYGTRGDAEPCAVIGRELQRRGHEVHLVVAPDLMGFVESVGLTAAPCGPDARTWQDLHREFLANLFRNFWKIGNLVRLGREDFKLLTQCLDEIRTALISSAEGADLLLTVTLGEQSAASVAEYCDIPLATLHTHPIRPSGQAIPILPAPLVRAAMTISERLDWLLTMRIENGQRRQLGLTNATQPLPRRIRERGFLEIQAYDPVCFPGLAAEWAQLNSPRPFVGALTMELPTEADNEVASWIARGTPPIFFGFGSTLVQSPADTIRIISAACAQLGQRALVCSAESDFNDVPRFEHVRVFGTMNYATAFPACRAVVHHGGAGTTAAALRAGVPQLIISTWLDQALWGARVKRLKVGTAKRFSFTLESLVADLRTILTPDCVARAREVATRMTKPSESVTAAADLLEEFVRLRRVG